MFTKNNDNFQDWFIGFSEGDGSFVVLNTGYLEFKLTQTSLDVQILKKIQRYLGFGKISINDKTAQTYRFRVTDKENLLKLIHIFNGNLYTQTKREQFKKWVIAFNKIYKTDIRLKRSQKKINIKTDWLTGFIDAEGCFSVFINKNRYRSTNITFSIELKYEEKTLKQISALINGNIYPKRTREHMHKFCIASILQFEILINYLEKSPLKTKKHTDYKNWLQIYKIIKDKEHRTDNGFQKIQELEKKINSLNFRKKRTKK